MNDLVLFEQIDNIGIIRLNRPDKKNALSIELLKELEEIMYKLKDNNSVRVLIIKGESDFFSAGGDFVDMLKSGGEDAELMSIRVQNLFAEFAVFKIPVIAQISGLVYGGGLELAMFCDIRIAADNVKLCMPEINFDIIPGAGGTTMLSKILGKENARYYLFTGKEIPLNLALNSGLIHELIPKSKLDQRCLDIANELSKKNSEVLSTIKKLLLKGDNETIGECFNSEAKEFRSLLDRFGKQKITSFFRDK